ncbi:MAG: putative nucleotidyltransferase substrate binding domain-containing protein [Actinomycetota bacterium]
MIAVDEFLRRYPPFDDLTPEQLKRVADSVRIEFFEAGTEILRQGGEPASFLYVVRTGAVELLDEGELVDLLVEGEAFGHPSLTSGLSPAFSVRAHEDTLCYLIDREVAEQVLATRPGLAFLSSSLRRRTVRALALRDVDRPDPRLTPVGALVHRPPVTARGDETVREAAQRMVAERVSSLLVLVPGGTGIVTDRDLRARVLAEGLGPDARVADVLTSPVITVSQDEPAEEALLSMLEHGVHHLPVTRDGRDIIGVVTDTDLMGLERATPFALRTAIDRAPTEERVVAEGRGLAAVVRNLVEAEVDPILVGHAIAMSIDAMTRRMIELAMADLGDPPGPWCWLALGSEARHEQAIATDQDHALAYDVADEHAEEADRYFENVAKRVSDALEAAGIPRCPGGVSAERPAWRRTRAAWAREFPERIADRTLAGRLFSSVALDYRPVAGPLEIQPVFDDAIRRAARNELFVRGLVVIAVAFKPPTGFFRDLVVEAGGSHAGTLDIKKGGIVPVTAFARARAIGLGLTLRRTVPRLRAVVDAGALDADSAAELEEAFRFLWRVRLEHQVRCLDQGKAADDHVDPRELGHLTRVGLKEAFRAIARAQRGLTLEAGLRLR